ncbi:hypothetical protein ABT299_29130 [Spirillospora sp. NPDC000708]
MSVRVRPEAPGIAAFRGGRPTTAASRLAAVDGALGLKAGTATERRRLALAAEPVPLAGRRLPRPASEAEPTAAPPWPCASSARFSVRRPTSVTRHSGCGIAKSTGYGLNTG